MNTVIRYALLPVAIAVVIGIGIADGAIKLCRYIDERTDRFFDFLDK